MLRTISDMQIDRRTFLAAAGLAAVRPAHPAGLAEAPFRQIHLDFHTSELIPDVGTGFNAAEFAATLKQAHVNSINVFAKCHHGYAYYDTKVGTRHPALRKDLLGEMIAACRPAGMAVNYYYSLVWDVYQSRQHPEWFVIDRNSEPVTGPPKNNWPWLCLNTPYFEQVLAENREILERYPADGAWFDILKQWPDGCFCKWCRAERGRLGIPDTAEGVFKQNKLLALRVEKTLYELVQSLRPKAATFFNSRLVIGVRDEMPFYSHVELESLPTGGWGYSHFQQRVRYFRTLGKEMVGMTGRFHKSWGDFGGLKNQAALDYECLNFLANGTKVCVGDQLHPRGRLDETTYRRIGRTYEKIEALEPWARGAKAVTDIGVMSVAATNPDMLTQKIPVVDQGFTNMLVELHQQFDVLDLESEFSRYKVVVLPDEIRTSQQLEAAMRNYVEGGGALLVSHDSLAASPLLGVEMLGAAKYAGEYMVLRREAFPEVDAGAYFLYQRGKSVQALPGTEVLATYAHPYFDRSPDQYSSHKQTPAGPTTDEPLITRRGKVIYVANPFFRSYAQDGYGVQKHVVGALLRMLLPDPVLVTPNLPSTAQATVMRQPGSGRDVVHVLYYPMTRRAPDIDIIEEPGLLVDVELRLRSMGPRRATLVPQGTGIETRFEGGYVRCVVPRVYGHQAVCFDG